MVDLAPSGDPPELKWPEHDPPIVLVGPTAVGKTDVAVDLALHIGGEIVSADSMQVYRGMDIGTAKPSASIREQVPMHLLDICNPDERFTAADWSRAAERAVAAIHARGRRAIICGGTGMYVRALLDNWSLAQTPADEAVRDALSQEALIVGSTALHARLSRVDPDTAARLHPNDTFRIVRALEVLEITGVSISKHAESDRKSRSRRPAVRIGIQMQRPMLYDRINSRVDAMMASGFIEEVRCLMESGYGRELNSMRSLGYKQIASYVCGEGSQPEVVEEIKRETRRYAKRQLTWFRADPQIQWIEASGLSPANLAARIWPAGTA